MLSGICERAIADAAKQRFAGVADAEPALVTFWIGYIDTAVSNLACILTIHEIDMLYLSYSVNTTGMSACN